MAIVDGEATLVGLSALIPQITVARSLRTTSKRLNGIALSQNQVPPDAATPLTLSDWAWQEWFLPSNFVRGEEDQRRVPTLNGFQFCANLTDGTAETAKCDWRVQTYEFGVGWVTLAQGVQTGAPVDGEEVWYEIYFDEPIQVSEHLDNRFRFGIKANGAGLTGVCYSSPNPLAATGNARAYTGEAGATPHQYNSADTSLLFRILAGTADEGTDFLGNQYRSVVVKNTVGNAASTADADVFWLSKPNPSRFAVESMYFDMRNDDGTPQVIDRILLDPITPGMYFHVYYSEGGSLGADEIAWDERLWEVVPQSFKVTKRETYALPNPITASFVKIDFSFLQAKHYSPGPFQKPVEYKKHPKWVLDYFAIRADAKKFTEDHFIANRVAVSFDALDLAYNYYKDDLQQVPQGPVSSVPEVQNVNQFFTERGDISDMVDPETLLKIDNRLKPYLEHPGLRGRIGYLPGLYSRSVAVTGLPDQVPDYPVEEFTTDLSPQSAEVSSINRDAVVFEQSHPIMFFYLQCRHRYRKVVASFAHDRAYFAGVREIAFLRDHYATVHDHELYIENADDNLNVERNDFVAVNHVLQAYPDAS